MGDCYQGLARKGPVSPEQFVIAIHDGIHSISKAFIVISWKAGVLHPLRPFVDIEIGARCNFLAMLMEGQFQILVRDIYSSHVHVVRSRSREDFSDQVCMWLLY